MINFAWWCVFGIAAGLIARFLAPGRHPMGCFSSIGISLLAAVLGGLFGSLFSEQRPSGVNLTSMVASAASALLVAAAYHQLGRPPRAPTRDD